MIAVGAIGIGLLLGWLAGGDFKAIGKLRLRYEIPVIAAFVVQGIARGRLWGTNASSMGLAVWVGASIALLIFLAANARLPGMLLAGTGVALNLAVVLANQGMPVVVAKQSAAYRTVDAAAGFYLVANRGTIGSWAADAISLGLLRQHFYLSLGDILLAAGVAILVAGVMVQDRGGARGGDV